MGWGGFSIGALRLLEQDIEQQSLIRLCQRWQTTHDVGLGVYTWMKSIPSIFIPQNSPIQDPQGGYPAVVWHKLGIPYDTMFEDVWQSHSKNTAEKFDLDKLVAYESAVGRKFALETSLIFPMASAKNTLFYHQVAVKNIVGAQIQESQRPISFSSDIMDFVPANCDADQLFYKQWYKEYSSSNPLENELKMCLDYSIAVSTSAVNISGDAFPPSDNLIRQ
jgi:hypothetical protein